MARQKTVKQAVALRYHPPDDESPLVTAKGTGATAERIIRIANEHNIPVHQDETLVQMLSLVELNEEIPPMLYAAVAEVLAFVYRVGNRHRG